MALSSMLSRREWSSVYPCAAIISTVEKIESSVELDWVKFAFASDATRFNGSLGAFGA
jgi:hypothetical protein